MSEVDLSDPAYQQGVFEDAYEQTCLQMTSDQTGLDIVLLARINQGRNAAIDEIASDFGLERGAECGSGCSSCCHQMVLCTPFEIFDIARHCLSVRSAAEIVELKRRLARLALFALDEPSRHGSDKPCALLETNACSIYDHRPSLCRTMLSTSRDACEKSLKAQAQTVPFIAEPVIMFFLIQLGIDYALIKHKNLSTEKVEMSRALLIALDAFDASLATWLEGREAFPNCHVEAKGARSNRDLAERAAARSGIA